MIRGASALQNAYRDPNTVRTYVEDRFREPLGAMLHAAQTRILKNVIRQYRPLHVLEIGPGPARLTVEVAPLLPNAGTLLDASLPMLVEAKRRLASRRAHFWRCVQGDVFRLPSTGGFDLIYTFRLIRHFEGRDRRRIYREIAQALRPGGLLIFDAVNQQVATRARRLGKPNEYRHYDALMRPEALRAELAEAGLELAALHGVQRCYPLLFKLQVLVAPRSSWLARAGMELVACLSGGKPLEWVVVCRRA